MIERAKTSSSTTGVVDVVSGRLDQFALPAALVDEPDCVTSTLWGLQPRELLCACTELVGVARAAIGCLDPAWWPSVAQILAEHGEA